MTEISIATFSNTNISWKKCSGTIHVYIALKDTINVESFPKGLHVRAEVHNETHYVLLVRERP